MKETKVSAEDSTVELMEPASGALGFIQKYRNIIIIVSIAIVVIGALSYFFKVQSDAKSNKASLALSRVLPFYATQDYDRALNGDPSVRVRGEKIMGLKAIVEEYGSTESGMLAALYAGNIMLDKGQVNEAKKYFETAGDSESELVVTGANAGIAACYEKENNFAEAAKLYEKTSKTATEGGIKERYLLYAGLCWEKANNKEAAIKFFREVIGLDEYSEFAGDAKSGLVRLGTIIE